MKVCSYCGYKGNTDKIRCPNCGALLETMTEPPKKIIVDNINKTQTPPAKNQKSQKTAKQYSVIIFIAVLFTGIFAASVAFNIFSDSNGQRNYSAQNSVTSSAPDTVEAAFSDSSFRQALELIFKKEISNITWHDVDSIKSLRIDINYSGSGDIIGYSFDCIPPDGDFGSSVVTTDSHTNDISELAYFSNLESLSISGVSISTDYIPKNKDMKYIALESSFYSGYNSDVDVSNLTYFANYPKLISLTVSGSDITSLKGITDLTGLQSLTISGTGISDLSLLSSVKNITSLELIRNDSLASVQTLANMTWLKQLLIQDEPFTTLHEISGLSGLEALTVIDTPLRNADFLTGLKQLKTLEISGCYDLLTLPSLKGLTSLESLTLKSSELDQSPIADLTGLKTLSLYYTDSLLPLKELKNLTSLTLAPYMDVDDVSPLANLSNLEYLKIGIDTAAELDDLSPIGKLKNLKILDLGGDDHTHYIYADFIYGMAGLEELNLSNDRLDSDFSKIKNMTGLKRLFLNGTSIEEENYVTAPLGQSAASVSIGELKGLQELDLGGNNLTDIKFLSGLTSLTSLNLSDNYITDASPLSGLTGLKFLDISKNAINNIDALNTLVNTNIVK